MQPVLGRGGGLQNPDRSGSDNCVLLSKAHFLLTVLVHTQEAVAPQYTMSEKLLTGMLNHKTNKLKMQFKPIGINVIK